MHKGIDKAEVCRLAYTGLTCKQIRNEIAGLTIKDLADLLREKNIPLAVTPTGNPRGRPKGSKDSYRRNKRTEHQIIEADGSTSRSRRRHLREMDKAVCQVNEQSEP